MLLQYSPLLPPAAHPLPPVCRSRSSREVFEGPIRRCSVGVWQHSRELTGNPGEDRHNQQHADLLHFRQRVGFQCLLSHIYAVRLSCVYLCMTSSFFLFMISHFFLWHMTMWCPCICVQAWTDAQVPRRQRWPSEMWKRHHIRGRHERASHRLLAWDHKARSRPLVPFITA